MNIPKVFLSGEEVFPIIDGGKGIGVSNGTTAGCFAAAGAVGTISLAFPPSSDEAGNLFPLMYKGKTRTERSLEIITQSVKESIKQIDIAHKLSKGKGRIHLNILWGLSGTEEILKGVLEKSADKVHGISCGAGMPFKMAEIAQRYNIYYYPIVSGVRTFSLLWNRAFNKVAHLLGGVVYEDPWLAGGHNGLSNKEHPDQPQPAIERIKEIRKFMNESGLSTVPIIMAGGVWYLRDYEAWMHNPEIAPIAFQLGTRTLLTKESPISEEWKKKLLTLKKGDVVLNQFSSTGFFSSAVNNQFMQELHERSSRQITYKDSEDSEYRLPWKRKKATVYIKETDAVLRDKWLEEGYEIQLKTPSSTFLFLKKEKSREILHDIQACKGCLAQCKFSAWSSDPAKNYTTGLRPDPRSFCIIKTLENIIIYGDVENELMFSGHNSYKFSDDPLYTDGNIPTTEELVQTMMQGD